MKKIFFILIFFKGWLANAQTIEMSMKKDSVFVYGRFSDICNYHYTDTVFYENSRKIQYVSYFYNYIRIRDKGFYENGAIKFVDNYDEEKQRNGIHAGWYENGQLNFIIQEIHGKDADTSRAWYESGEREFINYTINGIETEITYYKSGPVKSILVRDKNNQYKELVHKIFCENGLVTYEKPPNQTRFYTVWYYCNGKPSWEGIYDSRFCIFSGPNKSYYENGNLMAKGTYMDIDEAKRKFSGPSDIEMIKIKTWTYYYESGKKERIENYNDDGKKHGIWKYYNEKGHLIKVENYQKDSLIKTTNYLENKNKQDIR